MQSVVMLSVTFYCYSECHFFVILSVDMLSATFYRHSECGYAERG